MMNTVKRLKLRNSFYIDIKFAGGVLIERNHVADFKIHQIVQRDFTLSEVDIDIDARLEQLAANDRGPHLLIRLIRFHLESGGEFLFDWLDGGVWNDQRNRAVGIFQFHVEGRRYDD